jgi:tetrahydromethanopterin S-methyltransferase subunit B
VRRTVDELLAEATQHLQSVEVEPRGATSALQKINQALALAPEHSGAVALKSTAETALAAQRQNAVILTGIRNARNRFANGKYQAAFQLLENLDPSSNPVVADTLKELREARHEIEERRRTEEELAERQRQIAELTGAARAAIGAERFTEALAALSAARLIDATAAGLAELTEQALLGESRAAAARLARRAGVKPQAADTPARQWIDDGLAADADATIVILPPGTDANPRRVDEVEPLFPGPAHEDLEHDAREPTLGDDPSPGSRQPVDAVSRNVFWGLIVGVAALLLAILAVLFRLR